MTEQVRRSAQVERPRGALNGCGGFVNACGSYTNGCGSPSKGLLAPQTGATPAQRAWAAARVVLG